MSSRALTHNLPLRSSHWILDGKIDEKYSSLEKIAPDLENSPLDSRFQIFQVMGKDLRKLT